VTGGRTDKLRAGDLLGALTAQPAAAAATSTGRPAGGKATAGGRGTAVGEVAAGGRAAVSGGAGLSGADVGKIEVGAHAPLFLARSKLVFNFNCPYPKVMETKTWVAVRSGVAEEAAARLNGAKIKNHKYRVHLVK
jgi:hypothetical protein